MKASKIKTKKHCRVLKYVCIKHTKTMTKTQGNYLE